MAEEANWVWSDDEPLRFTNWAPSQPNNQNNEDAVWISGTNEGTGTSYVRGHAKGMWGDLAEGVRLPYICARRSTPTDATGGQMLGCAGGRWVLGAPYKQPTSTGRRLPPTIVRFA